jgi:proline iminopeptidase
MTTTTRRSFLAGATASLAAACAEDALFAAAEDVAPPREGEGRAPAEGGEIWYRVTGSGPGAPLVVVHGGPGLSHDYLSPLAALGRARPVVLYDQLDCGNSDHPNDPGAWQVGRFVSEIESLRRALGLTRFHLLGHSWGGLLAAEYAAGNPRRVMGRWRKLLPDEVRAVIESHEAAGTVQSAAYQEAMEVFYRRHLCRLDPWPEPLTVSLEKGNAALYVAMWGETEFRATGRLSTYDGSASLARIASPLLFTCGEFDQAPPATMYRYSRLVQGSEVRVFTDASHTPHLEQTDAYLHALSVFLNGIG